jgi:hypothetical protein
MSRRKAKKESGQIAESTKTRTYKSASEPKTISSQYGTPTETAGTAKQKLDYKPVVKASGSGQYTRVANKISKMSSGEVMETLRRAGIVTANRKLSAKYKKK